MYSDTEERERILEATIRVFKEKKLKLTMDDLASALGMSKKTIYRYFRGKDELFLAMADYCFDRIRDSQKMILDDNSLTPLEKLTRILCAMPESYAELDFTALYPLKDKYPEVYRQIGKRLDTGWEDTFDLIRTCQEEGTVRPFNVSVFKTMMESTLVRFFEDDFLEAGHLTYKYALNEVIEILINGIRRKEG